MSTSVNELKLGTKLHDNSLPGTPVQQALEHANARDMLLAHMLLLAGAIVRPALRPPTSSFNLDNDWLS